MKCRGDRRGVLGRQLAVAADGVGGRQRLHLGPAPRKRLGDRWVGVQAAVRAAADDEALGEVVDDAGEILDDERVAIPAPPVALDTIGEDDHVARVLLTVDGDAAELVVGDRRHEPIVRGPAPAGHYAAGMSLFDKLAELPISIESYELTGHDREYGSFTRPSTVIHLHGDGQEGLGEDVVYDVLDHMAHRDAGAVHDLTAPRTLGELCDLLGETDLFKDTPPERDASRHYRRWAYESAGLDLALRQNGVSLHEAVGRDPKPLNFVCSTRLSAVEKERKVSSTKPLRDRLARYPELAFKLDPENDWDAGLIAEISDLAPVRVLDLKGLYRGTPVDVDTDPELYRMSAEAFPEAYLEDPDLNEETEPVLEPHADRVTWDANLHSLDDVKEHARKAINSKPSRFGSLQELLSIYEWCEENGIAIYGGGQGELQVGRGQIQYLASLFHADTPNDTAPSGYNDPAVPEGMPTSPIDPVPSDAGFRWGEDGARS